MNQTRLGLAASLEALTMNPDLANAKQGPYGYDDDYTESTISSINQKKRKLSKLDIVRQKIQECVSGTNQDMLNLYGMELTLLPREIGQLSKLDVLEISCNLLTTLTTQISTCTNLKVLDLSDNLICKIPPQIGDLVNLTSLDLHLNDLDSLPAEIGKLVNLKKLDLSQNQLRTLPTELFQCTSLVKLSLWGNRLTTLPRQIGQLQSLVRLQLNDNRLQYIPNTIRSLKYLKVLYLHNNNLDALPPDLIDLRHLKTLTVHNNFNLSSPTLPDLYSSLEESEIDEFNCVQAVMAYFRALLPVVHHERMTLAHAFNNERHSDCVFIIEGRRLFGHKVILAARSYKLRSLIVGDEEQRDDLFAFKQETRSRSQFQVSDTRYPVFYALIQYLYTDQLHCTPEFADELLEAAEVYKCNRLKKLVENYIKDRPTQASKPNNYRFGGGPSVTGRDLTGTIPQDLEGVFNLKKYSDVIFLVEDKPIHAHKAILTARCFKFRALFEDDNRNVVSASSKLQNSSSATGAGRRATAQDAGSSEVVEMHDFSYKAFAAMLVYIYTGKVEIQPQIALELLMASNEYGLDELKEMCEEYIAPRLAVDTVMEVLQVSQKYVAPQLKRYCIHYIVSQYDEVSESVAYRNLDKRLADDIAQARQAPKIVERLPWEQLLDS